MNSGLNFYPKMKYLHSMKCFTNKYVSKINELCITKSDDKKNENSIIMINYNLKMHLIKENGKMFTYNGNILNNYDYYVLLYDNK